MVIMTLKSFRDEFDDSYDDNYEFLGNGQVIATKKLKDEEASGLYPTIYGIYILSQSKKLMNDMVIELGGDKENIIQYMDTDSLYIQKKYLDRVKDKFNCFGNSYLDGSLLGSFKNDYGENKTIVSAMYLGPKVKYMMLEVQYSAQDFKKEFEEFNKKYYYKHGKEASEEDFTDTLKGSWSSDAQTYTYIIDKYTYKGTPLKYVTK